MRAKPIRMLCGPVFLNLEKMSVVDHAPNQLDHVVRLVGILRHHRVELGVAPLGIILAGAKRRILGIVRRHEGEHLANHHQRALIVVRLEMTHAGALRMRIRAAQLLHRDFLMGGRADDVGAGDEHVRALAHHDDEIGHRGRINRAARARSHDRGNLRNHARRHHVAQENVGVAGERNDAFLDARAAAVVDADEGASDLHREVHHLADFFREGARQAAAEHGEVVREHADLAPVDGAEAGHHAVAGNLLARHVEVGDAMRFELVELDERAAIEQEIDPLARGHAAGFALFLEAFRAAAEFGEARHFLHPVDVFFKTHAPNFRAEGVAPARLSQASNARHAHRYRNRAAR